MFYIDNKNIAIILSEKSDGDMLFKNDNQLLNEKIKLNRQKFFQENNLNSSKLVNIAGIHSNHIRIIEEQDLGKGAMEPETRIKDTDGLVTNIKNSYLMVTGADCFSVFFYDEQSQVVGVAHCGWQGIIKNIIPMMINKLRENFNSRLNELKIWIGPGIKGCHFEVKKDVVESFKEKYETAIIKKDDKYYIDLPVVIKSQLIKSGISPENITEYLDCTYCQKEKWFSYRRDRPEYPETSAFIIGLK